MCTLIVFSTGVCSAEEEATKHYPFGKLTREELIQKFFTNRELDSIEGVWNDASTNWDIAIVKNTSNFYSDYDYIGIVFGNYTSGKFKGSQTMIAFRKMANSNVYKGFWVLVNGWGAKSNSNTLFVISGRDQDVINYNIIGFEQGVLVRTNYVQADAGQVKPSGTGTGFFITKNLIATNHHVVAKAKEVDIVLDSGAKIAATVVGTDPANDLAILKIASFVDLEPLKMGNAKNVKPGEPVFTIGHPLGDTLGEKAKVSEGIVNSIAGFNNDIRFLQISIPIQPGNSGGPMFNAKGEVVGITSSGMNVNVAQNVNFAIKTDYLYVLANSVDGGNNLLYGSNHNNLNAQQIFNLYKNAVVKVVAKA